MKMAKFRFTWSSLTELKIGPLHRTFVSQIKQTASALVFTLRSQAMIIQELFKEWYEYVIILRLQSDVVERRFSQYRQMIGGRFL